MRIHVPALLAAALAICPHGAAAEEAPAKPVKLVYRTVPPEAQETPLDPDKAT